jgi:hypothetical protein
MQKIVDVVAEGMSRFDADLMIYVDDDDDLIKLVDQQVAVLMGNMLPAARAIRFRGLGCRHPLTVSLTSLDLPRIDRSPTNLGGNESWDTVCSSSVNHRHHIIESPLASSHHHHFSGHSS